MIRMGRSSNKPEAPRPENSSQDASKAVQTIGTAPPQNVESPAPFRALGESNNRAFTESEGLARDIKEGRLSGYVGNGTTLAGETEFKTMLRVDGHLVGKIASQEGTLHVGATGHVDANIRVAAAVVHGTVNGDIFASERIELGRTAKVIGNIQAPSLMIEQGAILEGNCSMMKPRTEFDKRATQKTAEVNKAEDELRAVTNNRAVNGSAIETEVVTIAK